METLETLHAEPSPSDARAPREIAQLVETAGVAKARLGGLSTLALGILGGAFIALGADFSAVVALGSPAAFGLHRLVSAACFSLGLVLVVGAGAELFTGNNLIVMAWASGRIRACELFRNWAIVYAGNAIGAAATALAAAWSGQWRLGDGALGEQLWRIAALKSELDPFEAFLRGVLCNALVCLAVWLSMGARGMAEKILAVVFPVTAFVACGFEHSIANLFYFPAGLLAEAASSSPAGGAAPGPGPLSIPNMLLNNLLPVTLGNVVGGGGLVAGVYWLVYLRPANPRGGGAPGS